MPRRRSPGLAPGLMPIGRLLRTREVDDRGRPTPSAKEALAEQLRDNQTPGERMFGRVLHHLGIQAQPQVVVRGYIVDFLDEPNRVIFEVDGPIHRSQVDADARRDRALIRAGYRVVRITNDGVRNLMASVAAQVANR